ncbi:MAG: hypothetical protein JWL63_1502 [Rhodocyclales bacterium]|nr:hypothetical protein [Rhodocyclales bacterium]
MAIQQTHADARAPQHMPHHIPGKHDAACADSPGTPVSGAAMLHEQFRPAPLSSLVAWFFRPRHQPVTTEPEQFDEHINGLA